MASTNIPNTPSEYRHYIAQSVASTYVCLLNDTTVAKINTLPMNVAEDMAREVDYQLHKMQSLKALLHVRVREAKHEEEKRRASTVDTAWGELQRKRKASEVNVNIKSPMTPHGPN